MMYIILADIHANLEAFQSVISVVEPRDQIWSLGDISGYGPNPNECIDLIREGDIIGVAGNHDLASVGKIETINFNPMARRTIDWTKSELVKGNKHYLENLPEKLKPIPEVTLVHGSPRDPVWEYLLETYALDINFGSFDTQFCFVGHSHVPFIFQKSKESAGFLNIIPGQKIKLNRNYRYIINPGAIGQPRDNDPRASFMVFDADNFIIHYRRISYPINKIQDKMKTLEFPSYLVDRLARGQ